MNPQLLKTAAILLAISVSAAHATTKQTFGGTMCESLYDVNSVYGENVDYQYGSIINRSNTYWGYIDCPVPRANGYSSGSVLDLEVSVEDTNGSMWCSAYVADRYNNITGSETVFNTAGTTGSRVIDFGSVPGGAPYEGTIRVFCVLPPNGGSVHSIVVDVD